MKKINRERAYASATLSGFPFPDAERKYDGMHAADKMVNLRPLGDGSIRKRGGYRTLVAMSEPPRAVYTGYLDGEEVLYVLSGGTVYRRYLSGDTYGFASAGRIETYDGDAAFAEFSGRLWLFDGDCVYVLSGDRFERAEGYIPLYGKGWDPLTQGEILEAENLLTPRVRITYHNSEKRDTIYFGRRALSVDRVFLDGVEEDVSGVELLSTGNGCVSERFLTAETVELLLTLDAEDGSGAITSSRRAIAYGGARDNRLFTWDGADASAFYASEPVSVSDAALSDERGGGYGGALYFPRSAELYRVDAPVTAVCRYYDRLLIFTASGAWAADCSEKEELSVTPVHSTVGCDKKDCAVLCGNAPVTYFGGKLWRWSARSTTQRECSAEILSSPVAADVAEMRGETVLMQYYAERTELWVTTVRADRGRVLIYNAEREGFYTFEGISASRLVPSGSEPMFLDGEILYVFDDACLCDEGNAEIRALYRTAWIDLGAPERTKRLQRFSLLGDPDGGRLTVRLESERGYCAAVDLFGRGEVTPNAYERRISLGRLRYFRASVEAGGTSRPSVQGMTVRAKIEQGRRT
ncbi:MAG: hypothetical protein IKC26_01020 [Clostridia bacterium]|nr:hypothetical protein [Clostridia bacterium]